MGVAIVAVFAAVYIVFTPKHLTPVVDKVAREYISADYRLSEVELTFFSTFPEFGLRTGKVLILSPTEGAQSDTLLAADHLVARIELEQLIKQGCINIRELAVQEAQVNLFIAENGTTNFDILNLPEDTTQEDTTSSFIRSVKIEDLRVAVDAKQLTLLDLRDTVSATLRDIDIALRAETRDSLIAGNLGLAFPSLSANYKGVDYASEADIRLAMPFEATVLWTDSTLGVDSAHLTLGETQLAVNQFHINLTGEATVLPEIDMDLHLRTNTWVISELLALVPKELFTLPEEIKADGRASVRAHVYGKYNESSMPLVLAHLNLSGATGEYTELPYTLENVKGNVDLNLDLNHHYADAIVNELTADVKSSTFAVAGQVKDILNDMFLDLSVDADLNIPDAAYFFPKNTTAKGQTTGTIQLKMLLEDLKNLNLTKGNITGDLRIRNALLTSISGTRTGRRSASRQARVTYPSASSSSPRRISQATVKRTPRISRIHERIVSRSS